MSTTTEPNCPQCGAPLLADSPAGLCPRCLMDMNLATQTVLAGEDAGTERAGKSPPPTPEEIAKFFPNFEILESSRRIFCSIGAGA